MPFIIDAKLFAENLRYFREKASWTHRDLDNVTKLTVGVLVTLERGVRLPTDEQLRRLAAALHISPTTLIMPLPRDSRRYRSC